MCKGDERPAIVPKPKQKKIVPIMDQSVDSLRRKGACFPTRNNTLLILARIPGENQNKIFMFLRALRAFSQVSTAIDFSSKQFCKFFKERINSFQPIVGNKIQKPTMKIF